MPRPRTTAATAAFRAMLAPAATGTLFLLLIAAGVLGYPRLHRALASADPRQPLRVQVEWPLIPGSDPPATWLPAEFRNSLTELAESSLRADADPLSPRALKAAADALLATGWFERLDGIRRETGGTVRVTGRWRVPAAVVRYAGLDHLVARGGELLPPTYLPGESGQKVIFGVSAPPPGDGRGPACGKVWAPESREVLAALELLALMADRPWRDQVAGIDAAGYAKGRRLEIVTVFGTRIAWGGAPSDAVPGEQTAHYKLRRLDVLAQRFGQIDGHERLVDITGPLTLIDQRPAGSP
jgi:hypothetical protein